jgi:hypothetical protein
VHYTLKRHGTEIARRTVVDDSRSFAPRLPVTGRYLLVATATRHPIRSLPGNVLSPRAALRFHFFADRDRHMQVGGFITQFVPRGLSRTNHARTRATTVVLKPRRPAGPRPNRDAVKNMRVWSYSVAEHDWNAVPVRHSNGQWSTTIRNPASGYVSLRATVSDTHGNNTTTQVRRVYATN